MQGKCQLANATDPPTIQQLSRAITGWDPLLSVKLSEGEFLYDGVRTCYGVSIGQVTTLSFRDRQQQVSPGDAIVLPPAIRLSATPAARFLWVCHEGLAPEHLRGPRGIEVGFEHCPLQATAPEQSDWGQRRPVLSETDVRHRAYYDWCETLGPLNRTHDELVALYYVLSGEGQMQMEPAGGPIAKLPLRAGQICAIGPGLPHAIPSGLVLANWYFYSEMAHRRRVRR